jgi:outer membrane protein assembly factor BamB
MGLLMRAARYRSGAIPGGCATHILPAILLIAGAAGCSGLRLDSPLRYEDVASRTFAGNMMRNNEAVTAPAPPLVKAWEQDVSAGFGEGSPLLIDSVLFVGNLRGELYAFNARTGKRFGWVNLGGAIHGAPVIDAGLAFVPLAGSRESFIAYDFVEGKIRWRQALGEIHVSPLLLDARLYVANTAGSCFCIARDNGETLWTFALPGNTTAKGIRSTAAGTDTSIVFGADDGYLYHLGATTGALLWRINAGAPIQASPVIHGDRIFVGTLAGRCIALERATGTQVWAADVGGSIYGPALVDSSLVITGTTAGTIVALHRASGGVAWEADLRAPVNTGILGVGPHVYAATLRKELVALDRATGAIVWRTTLEGRVKTTPVAGAGFVYVAADNRIIQAFRGADK